MRLRMQAGYWMVVVGLLLTGFFSGVESASAQTGGPVIGPPFAIANKANNDEMDPSVAYNSTDDEFLVVWTNNWSGGSQDIYARRVSPDGKQLSWFFVGSGADPSVAYNSRDNNYLIVWSRLVGSDYDVYGMRVWDAQPQGLEFVISSTLLDETSPSVAYNSHSAYSQYMVVWEEWVSGTPTIVWAQRVAGKVVGGGSQLVGSKWNALPYAAGVACGEPDAAHNLARNEYLVVGQCLVAGKMEVRGWISTAAGSTLSASKQLIVAQDAMSPAVAANNIADQYLITYGYKSGTANGEVWAMFLDGDMSGVRQSQLSDASTPSYGPDVARIGNSQQYWAVWTALPGGGTHQVQGMRLDTAGNRTPEFPVSDNPSWFVNYDAAVAGGGPFNTGLVAWSTSGAGSYGWDVWGRMLGYRSYLPVLIKK